MELSEADLLQFLDSQEPSLQVALPQIACCNYRDWRHLCCIWDVNAGMLETVHCENCFHLRPAQALES